ncbi:MAG TPA: sigma-70 family RNA polymerase sigma factor [Candidatus Limnocylindrales bacterium]|nr:sigma-70 family RNA polymerase sigma factor [Candidatus Limnocylindrales bacterium]
MDGPLGALAIPIGRGRVTAETASFAALVEGQLDRAFRLATVILGSAIEAEDAVADAALAAWRSRGDLRKTDRFEAWFGRILVNVCRDRLRSRRRRPVTEMPASEIGGGRLTEAADFRDGVHARDAMSRAFETLEPDERIVLVLRFWHDLTVEAIADRVGIPAGTVKSRLHHATARLRAALAAMEVER